MAPSLRPPASGGAARPPAVTARGRRRGISFGRPVNAKGLAIFTRQLATLVKAGMPILRSLEVLARQEKRPAFKRVIEEIADTIRAGGNFSDGLAAHEKVFDRLYVNMVKAGEAGGVLDTVLERLAVFMEKAQRLKRKIKGALVYPTVVVIVAIAIVTFIMWFIVPKFEEIFRDFGVSIGWKPDAMQDHLKLIPRQVVQIVREDPHVLDSYDNFVAATFGPQ